MAGLASVGHQPAIGLVWEGRGEAIRVVQHADSTWVREPAEPQTTYRGLTSFEFHGGADERLAALSIDGPRTDILDLLIRTTPGYFALVHVELPRTVLDDRELQFRADDPLPERVWLDVAEALLSRARRLARPDAVISVLCGNDDGGLARVLCDELLGRQNRIGDVVWQKAYAPHDQKPTKQLTAVHDNLLLYAISPTLLRPVGLRGARGALSNPDDDPRGPWIAEHKGAPSRRKNTDFDAFRPPYRWSVGSGTLPPGIWRLSPMTGVLWGPALEMSGSFTFTAEVTDAAGNTATKRFAIDVSANGTPPEPAVPEGILNELGSDGESLRVTTKRLPNGVVGAPYYAALTAMGGEPHIGEPRRPSAPRYWEYSWQTLAGALEEDMVDFGTRGDAIARIKRYPDPDQAVANQTTWWPGRRQTGAKTSEVLAGYSQDARKHLQALKTAAHIDEVPASPKPEALMARIIDIFVPPGGTVLEVNAEAGDLTAVAIKRGRPAVCLTGEDDRGRNYAYKTLLPRLRAVIDGNDRDLRDARGKELSTDIYMPHPGGGRIAQCELGPVLATYDPAEERFEVSDLGSGLAEAVLTVLGFLPDGRSIGGFPGATGFDGQQRAVCLPPGTFLTPELALDLAQTVQGPLTIGYFRAEGLDHGLLEAAGAAFSLVRVPYDLPR